jgi:hypothetical protein
MFIESNPRKDDPDIPEFPKIEPAGWAAKNSPRFNLYFEGERGSNTFAADPPGRLNFRRGCKEMEVKTRAAMTGRFRLPFVVLLSARKSPNFERCKTPHCHDPRRRPR